MIYNYITTNVLNGKQYVGMHSTEVVDDGYLGSGKCLLQAIRNHGKKNFKRRILCVCKTEQEAYVNESLFIQKYNTISPNGYNISPMGGLGFHGSFSEEIKQTMKDNHADYSGENHPRFGIPHTEESKKKNSKAMLAFYQTEKGKLTLKEMGDGKKGKQQSEESNRKRRDALKGRKRPKEVGDKISKGLLGKPHSEERKQKNRESQIKRMENPELREKQRQASLKQWEDNEWKLAHTGENHPMFNKHHSLETREKQRISHLKQNVV